MKKSTLTLLALATSALFSSQAMANVPDTVGKTRDQVRAELMEAIRTGDMPAPRGADEFSVHRGSKLNEVYPERYPARASAPAKTREQVRAELAEAIRTGDMPALHTTEEFTVHTGSKLNEVYPERYPAKLQLAGKTREQVRAELEEAMRHPAERPYWDIAL